jgi:hypothetical protein
MNIIEYNAIDITAAFTAPKGVNEALGAGGAVSKAAGCAAVCPSKYTLNAPE